MDTREIVKDFLKEVEICNKNIVINDCEICGKLFQQKTPIEICDECKKITEDVF